MENENKKKKSKVLVFILVPLLCIAFAFGGFIGGFFVTRARYGSEMATYRFILDTYKANYYKVKDNLPYLFSRAITDEYSCYYTAEEFAQIQKASQGYSKSFGFSRDSQNRIIKIAFNSPCDLAGMKVGGQIVEINGTKVNPQDDISSLLGDSCVMKVDYSGEIKQFNIEKKENLQTYVKYYDGQKEYSFKGENTISLCEENCSLVDGYALPSDTAYIVYTGFEGINNSSNWESDLSTSVGQFYKCMEIYKNSSKTKIIIDLRNNGGGYVSVLEYIVSHFVSEGEDNKSLLLMTEKYSNKTEYSYTKPVKKGNYNFESITILGNSNTASASECFIGAVLDYDKDNIVKVVVEDDGKGVYRTYGKGIMQDTFVNILTNEAFKLTVAEIFWPKTNISIHGVGVRKTTSSKVYEAKDSLSNPINALEYAINM